MIRADCIDKEYYTLDIGDIFTYKTRRRIDEYVVVGFEFEYGIRIPLAVKLFPEYKITTVHEVRNVD